MKLGIGKSKPGDSIFKGIGMRIQRELTMADGMTASKPPGGALGYAKGLINFKPQKAKITSMVITMSRGDDLTTVTVVITNKHGVEQTHVHQTHGLTHDNAKASGESVAVFMTTKAQHGKLCASKLTELVDSSTYDEVTFNLAGDTLTTETSEK